MSVRSSYFFLLLGYGIYVPFFPMWLAARGANDEAIGIILAIPLVARIVLTLAIIRLGEKTVGARATYILCGLGGVAGYCGMASVENMWCMVAWFALASAFAAPLIPLLDSITVELSRLSRYDYGRLRQWGSIAYLVAAIGLGGILSALSISIIPVALISVALATTLVGWTLPDLNGQVMVGDGKRAPVVGDRIALVTVICVVSALQGAHAFLISFASLSWRQHGFSTAEIGAFWATGVVAEICFFALSGRLFASMQPVRLIVLGGVAGSVRWLLMSLDPSFAVQIVPLQLLHGLSFGAVHIGTMRWISDNYGAAPSYQGLVWAATGAVTALLTIISGLLFSTMGILGYLAMSLVAAVAVLTLLVVQRRATSS